MRKVLKVIINKKGVECVMENVILPQKEEKGAFCFTEGELIAISRDYIIASETDENTGEKHLEKYLLKDNTRLLNMEDVRSLSVGQMVEISYVTINENNIAISVEVMSPYHQAALSISKV